MTAQTTITSVGIKDALRTLNNLDKRARRQITQDYKEIVQPIIQEAGNLTPTKAPLSGFDRSWTPQGASSPVLPYMGRTASRPPSVPRNWQQTAGGRRQMGKWLQWKQGQKAYISGKRPQTIGNYTRNLAAFGVQWQGPAAVLFDTSGQPRSARGAQMIAALNARFGPPSRSMWRAYMKTEREVRGNVDELVKRIMREAQEAIERNKDIL